MAEPTGKKATHNKGPHRAGNRRRTRLPQHVSLGDFLPEDLTRTSKGGGAGSRRRTQEEASQRSPLAHNGHVLIEVQTQAARRRTVGGADSRPAGLCRLVRVVTEHILAQPKGRQWR